MNHRFDCISLQHPPRDERPVISCADVRPATSESRRGALYLLDDDAAIRVLGDMVDVVSTGR
jgi:hypothetical protein